MPTRRDWLLGTAAILLVRDALAQGRVEKGVRRQSGDVRISGETISTGADGQAVFVVGRDAMLVRPNSSLTLVTNGFRLVTGAVLSVFAPGEAKQLRTPTATIGIRGTAAYIEAEPDRTYICTCYGEAVLEPLAEPAARETVRTRHHEQPRYIMPKGAPQMIMLAPMINHSDAELELLESLVGRKPPFSGGPPYNPP